MPPEPLAVEHYDLDAEAVAPQFGVTAQTVKKWARDGQLRGFRTPGGWWRFRQSDVDEFIRLRTSEPLEAAS